MGFFDFFKKRKVDDTINIENITDIDAHIDKISTQVSSGNKEIIVEIKNNIDTFIKNIENHVETLQKVDLTDKKAEDRVKLIVKGSIKGFIEHLNRLNMNLNDLSKEAFNSAQEIENSINLVLSDFEKKSFVNYEKATYLVGDEMADVIKSINAFSKELKNILKNNENNIDASKLLNKISNENENLNELNREIENIKHDLESSKNKIDNLNNEISNLNKEYESIKTSNKYLEYIKNKEKIISLKSEIKKNINSLQKHLDLKELAKKFYSSKKNLETIKEYRNNFHNSFMKELGNDLIEFLKEEKNDKGINIIKDIQNKISDEKRLEKDIPKLDPLEKIELSIHNLQKTADDEKELLEKFSETLSEKKEHKKDMQYDIENLKIELAKSYRLE